MHESLPSLIMVFGNTTAAPRHAYMKPVLSNMKQILTNDPQRPIVDQCHQCFLFHVEVVPLKVIQWDELFPHTTKA